MPLYHAGGKLAPQFFPSLEGIVQLFSRPATAASLWIHLLCINLFAARWAYQDGEQSSWLSTLHT